MQARHRQGHFFLCVGALDEALDAASMALRVSASLFFSSSVDTPEGRALIAAPAVNESQAEGNGQEPAGDENPLDGLHDEESRIDMVTAVEFVRVETAHRLGDSVQAAGGTNQFDRQ